jgi:iron complex outermembrane receptor protein
MSNNTHERSMQRAGTATGVMAASVFLVTAAHAQSASSLGADPQQSPLAASHATIEEIVVTAQKRSENLEDVPLSISAVTAASLQRLGVNGTLDLQTLVPGFQVSQVNAASTPSIRGVGSTDPSGGNEGAVALYVDGVYFPSQNAGLFSFPDIERVEVLKGPQGTLFGRNATAGLVNVITKNPTQETQANVTVGYGNFRTDQEAGYFSTGITPEVATSISAYHTKQNEGWGRNLFNGSDVYRSDETGVRGKILATPGENTRIILSADYIDSKTDIGEAFLPSPASAPYTVDVNLTPRGEIKDYGGNLRVEQEFSFAKLVSISGYRHVLTSYDIDQDRSPIPIVNALVNFADHSFTQELQLVSKDDGKLKWIFGGFYMGRTVCADPLTIEGLALAPAGLESSAIFACQKTRSLSGFAQASYEILDQTHLTVGARYTSDRQTEEGHDAATLIPGAPTLQILDPAAGSVTFAKPTYRVALDHKLGGALVYASFDRGFKAGYFNLQGFPTSSVRPEVLDSVQVGIKQDFYERRLRIDADAFYYKYSDIQIILVQNGSAHGVNAGKAKVNGYEFNATALPMDELNLRAGVTWLPTARYDTFDPCPSATQAGETCNDSRMIRAPRVSATMGADYTFSSLAGEFTPSLSFNYSSAFPWVAQASLATTPAFSEPSYGVLNGRVAWRSPSQHLTASLWTKNVTNRNYNVYGTNDAFGNWTIPAAPRTYGVTVGYIY